MGTVGVPTPRDGASINICRRNGSAWRKGPRSGQPEARGGPPLRQPSSLAQPYGIAPQAAGSEAAFVKKD